LPQQEDAVAEAQQEDAVAEYCRVTRHGGDDHSLGNDHLQQADEENPSRNSLNYHAGDLNMKSSRGMFSGRHL
jgi:hypothetical protein